VTENSIAAALGSALLRRLHRLALAGDAEAQEALAGLHELPAGRAVSDDEAQRYARQAARQLRQAQRLQLARQLAERAEAARPHDRASAAIFALGAREAAAPQGDFLDALPRRPCRPGVARQYARLAAEQLRRGDRASAAIYLRQAATEDWRRPWLYEVIRGEG
jgi:hypothetical protein